MKPSLFTFFVILLIFTVFGWTNNFTVISLRLQRSTGEDGKNIGCDLFNSANVMFKYEAIVFYSQRLIYNSFSDIERLLSQLMALLSSCCSSQPPSECFFRTNLILQGKICEDRISLSKNSLAALCCSYGHLDREKCFMNLQNNSTLSLPPLGDHISNEEECLVWAADKQLFIESYLHSFARRLTKFPPSVTIHLFHSLLQMYMKCCERSENIQACFPVEKIAFPVSITNKMKLENQMCFLTKMWEQENKALIFYAKMKPGDPEKKALDFDKKFVTLASKCCEPDSMTSECFETWPDILFTRFCLLMEDNLHRACCLKSNPEKENCLTELAAQESKTVSDVSIGLEEICTLSKNNHLFYWIAYEYPRRHQNETITALLETIKSVNTWTSNCCASKKKCVLRNFYKFFAV